jgi:hypothetical protein
MPMLLSFRCVRRSGLISLAMSVVAACGGGGGSNEPPTAPVNNRPEFGVATAFSYQEGDLFKLPVDVSDADGDRLTLELNDTADAAFFFKSGDLELAPAKLFDFDSPEDEDGDNTYELELSASDGQYTVTASYSISILDRPGSGFFEERGAAAMLGTIEFSDAGSSVASIGDIDGDNWPELLVSAPRQGVSIDGTTYRPGMIYVVSGKAIAEAPYGILELLAGATAGIAAIDGSVDTEPFSEIGADLTGIGDIDGDGLPEVAIGSHRWGSAGAVFIARGLGLRNVLQNRDTIPVTALASVGAGLRIDGSDSNADAGFRLASISDLDNDGRDELAICAPGATEATKLAGMTYIIMGEAIAKRLGGGPVDLEQIVADQGGIRLAGSNYFASDCHDLADAGDFDGDAVNDIIIGEARGGIASSSRVHVVYGQALTEALSGTGMITLANLEQSGQGVTIISSVNLDDFGTAVAGAGDFNGDGFDDILLGAPTAALEPDDRAANFGKAYIVWGTDVPFTNSLVLQDVSALGLGIDIVGDSEGSAAGISVTAAGDINGDGFSDVLVAASGSSVARDSAQDLFVRAGKVHLLFGNDAFTGNQIRISEAFDGISIYGVNQGSRFGNALDVINADLDLDADAIPDFVIGVSDATTCLPGIEEPVGLSGAAFTVSGQRLLDAHADGRDLDLADVMPHARLWTAGACGKQGHEWLR